MIEYASRRLLTRAPVRFEAGYRGLGVAAPGQPEVESLEYFLTERYCLFTAHGGRVSVGHIHHLPWPLQTAEAEIRVNELPGRYGITLPQREPVLHFARALEVYVWGLGGDVDVLPR